MKSDKIQDMFIAENDISLNMNYKRGLIDDEFGMRRWDLKDIVLKDTNDREVSNG